MSVFALARTVLALPATRRAEAEVIDVIAKTSGKKIGTFAQARDWVLSNAGNAVKGTAAMLGIDAIVAGVTDTKSLVAQVADIFTPEDAAELVTRIAVAQQELTKVIEADADAKALDPDMVSRLKTYEGVAKRMSQRFSLYSREQLIQLRADIAAMVEIPQASWEMAVDGAV